MQTRIHRSIALVALLAAACGDAPRPADATPPQPAPTAGALPPGHPSLDQLPAGHPPVSGASAEPGLNDPSQFAGRAVLKGEVARASEGRVMVTLRQKGMRMPLWAYVVDLSDPDAEKKGLMPLEGDQRELIFALNKDTTIIPSPLPPGVQLEVEVRYDADGNVDTKHDYYAGVADAKPGDLDLEIVLDKPAAQQ